MKSKTKNTLCLLFVCLTVTLSVFAFTGCGSYDYPEVRIEFHVGSQMYYCIESFYVEKKHNGEVTSCYISGRNSCEISFPAVIPKGYLCHGWYFDNNDWSDIYTEDKIRELVSNGNTTIKLYAKTEPVTYTINYTNTCGADLNHLPKKYTIESEIIQLPDISVEHYRFRGWYLNGEKVTEISSGSVGNIALEAKFTPIEYDIMFEGTKDADNSNPLTYNVDNDDIVLQPLTKEGYKFEGWYIDDKKVNRIPTANGGNIEVHAKWALTTYTISYENVNGLDTSNFPQTFTIESETIKLPDISVNHYKFQGWYFSGTKVTEIRSGSAGDIKLEAKLVPIEYDITYAGTKDAENTNPITYNVDNDDIVLQPLTKEGYKFEGWYVGDEKVNRLETANGGNIEVVAKWSPIIYTITYENVNDVDTSNFPQTFTIESEEIILPMNIEVMCRVFNGWYINDTKITKIATGTTSNIVLTANYSEAHKYVQDIGFEPTCISSGLTNGSHCSVCNSVLIYPTEIPALGHDYVANWTWNGYESVQVDIVCSHDSTHNVQLNGNILVKEKPATCQREGLKTYVGSVEYGELTFTDEKTKTTEKISHRFAATSSKETHICEMCKGTFDHSDVDYDGYCEECNYFIEEIIEINNSQDLLEIINNMEGAYVLKSDIALSGSWGGLGSTNNPFRGKFYGNGHTISGLSYTVNPNPGGLFISNQGLIDGLTLKDFSITMYSGNAQSSATFEFAALATYNYGTIRNCKITGVNAVNTTNDYNLQTFSTNYTFTGGSLCAKNYGTIDGCSIEGTVNNLIRASCHSFHNGLPGMEMISRVTSTVYFGNIAGINEGTISNTSVTGVHNVQLRGQATHEYGIDESYVTINVYVGSLVGLNRSVLSHCSAKAYVKTEKITQDSSGCAVYLNVKNASQYEGIIAVNNGKIEKFSRPESTV